MRLSWSVHGRKIKIIDIKYQYHPTEDATYKNCVIIKIPIMIYLEILSLFYMKYILINMRGS